MYFQGNYRKYFEFCKKGVIFQSKYLRIVKNTCNLGLWIVKDSQNRVTLNLWNIRVQF